MGKDNGMAIVEHLGELRKRIIYILIVFVLSMVIGLVLSDPIIHYLKGAPPASKVTWNAFSPWDALRIYMNVSFAVGMVISLPFTLYQLWVFVRPGLRPVEQKVTVMYIPGVVLLMLVGLSFGYFVVFPMAFRFSSILTQQLNLTATFGITQYFSFMFNILIPLSILFELPVVVLFLTKLRILNPHRMIKFRRYAYVLLLVIGALITPPDAISATIVAFPMILLYEFSVFLSRNVYRKQLLKDQEWEEEYGAK